MKKQPATCILTTLLIPCLALLVLLAEQSASNAVVIVDDSWADGGRDDGPDPLDSNWWTSSSSSGIEVSVGSLGLVTGTSGRGIHTVFPAQTLNVGDSIKATYTFTTPATVGRGSAAAFRVGLFDTLGRAGLNDNVSASSGSPNELYGWSAATPPTAGLPGYMMDMDIVTGEEDLNFREHDATTTSPTGRLMATTSGFTALSPSGPDGEYLFMANTTYTGSLMLERISDTEMEITGTLNPGLNGVVMHSVTDVFDSATVDMLGFHVNSNIFGSSSTAGDADNGIDFSNITIEYLPIPEPASLMLISLAGLMVCIRR